MPNEVLEKYTQNQMQILRQIAQQDHVTRSQLVELTGFQLLTITKTVRQLLRDGLLTEVGFEDSTGGRKAVLLSINPTFRYTLAVDLGSTCARIGVVGMDGSVIESEIVNSPIQKNGLCKMPACPLTVTELREKLQKLIDKYTKEKILGIGLVISGIVRHSEGRIVFCPNISGWNEVDVIRELQEPLGVPVFADSSGRGMALAESRFGAGRGIRNQIAVSIGNSVSVGIILDGQLYRGANEAAGELGHVAVRSDTLRCTCGNTGCLELYVAHQIISSRVRKRLKASEGFSVLRPADPTDLTLPSAKQIVLAAEQGDRIALDVLTEASESLGLALSQLVNILNPELIILGGATIDSYPSLLADTQRIVRMRSMSVLQQDLKIRRYQLGLMSAMIGAALQVIDRFFE